MRWRWLSRREGTCDNSPIGANAGTPSCYDLGMLHQAAQVGGRRQNGALLGALVLLAVGALAIGQPIRAESLEIEVIPPNPAPGQLVRLELRGVWPTNCPLSASAVPDGPVQCEDCAIRAWTVHVRGRRTPECWTVPTPFVHQVQLATFSAGTVVVGVFRAGETHLREPLEEFLATTEITVGGPSTETATFFGGRFAARTTWHSSHANGVGRAVAPSRLTPVSSSKLFWFFNPENWELLVKMLDGCWINGHYWVFGAGATDVGLTLEIEDTATGASWTHSKPLGFPTGSFADVQAFRCDAENGAAP